MNHRQYPDVDRALDQLERGRLRNTRPGFPLIDEAMFFGQLPHWQKAFLAAQGILNRAYGKSAITAALTKEAVAAGEHVHVAGRDGMRCAGGDDDCTTLSGRPLVIARAVETCSACPSMWDAWTTGGQYLYLRYRSGIGTVDAYDSPDSEQWTEIPTGRVARFGEPSMDGCMSLEDFCVRAGLELAEDLEAR
ncbi:hypothetical protein AB0M87_04580 [Streptomyces sp. NPDC051320]|uniref:hypothetical protein n=1 Tax=Streptomyces sp. NPDC051320 TaxID=3154644 RepID=UPI003420E74F